MGPGRVLLETTLSGIQGSVEYICPSRQTRNNPKVMRYGVQDTCRFFPGLPSLIRRAGFYPGSVQLNVAYLRKKIYWDPG
jgi:hypothetical protein